MRFLTADLPGTGGTIKAQPSDFRVTEVPLYLPAGEGDHTYVYVEKTGLGSIEAADRIARALGRPGRQVGLAGLKDARAVTRQWMSLERADPERVRRLDLPGIRILEVARHRNKLKIGHLAGNRFEVRLRGPGPGTLDKARAVLDVLGRRGLPNGFDVQRFGQRGDNHLLGRDLVLGRYPDFCDRFLGGPTEADSARFARARRAYDAGDLADARKGFAGSPEHVRVLQTLMRRGDPKRAARAVSKRLTRLLVSACQSALFNDVLDRRLETFDEVMPGDLAYLHGRGAVFLVEDAEVEAPRAARFEISPTGPLVGHRVRLAEERPGEIERKVLDAKDLAPKDFERVKALRLRGERRPLRVPLVDAVVSDAGEDLLLAFTLPPGAYATLVLAEVTKQPTPL